MGTRSSTVFVDDFGEKVCCVWRQYDSHPDSHGIQLAEAMKGMKRNEDFLGIGCLAASVIQKIKSGAGNISIFSTSEEIWDCGEEYVYWVTLRDNRPYIKCEDAPGQTLFEGFADEFSCEWAKEQDKENALKIDCVFPNLREGAELE